MQIVHPELTPARVAGLFFLSSFLRTFIFLLALMFSPVLLCVFFFLFSSLLLGPPPLRICSDLHILILVVVLGFVFGVTRVAFFFLVAPPFSVLCLAGVHIERIPASCFFCVALSPLPMYPSPFFSFQMSYPEGLCRWGREGRHLVLLFSPFFRGSYLVEMRRSMKLSMLTFCFY